MTTITISDATNSYTIITDSKNALNTSHIITNCFAKQGLLFKARDLVQPRVDTLFSSDWLSMAYLDIGVIAMLAGGCVYTLLK